ncbi:MAG: hypothetical protein ABIA21_04020 [Candidatus Aenigmatarchaeota archaeon]
MTGTVEKLMEELTGRVGVSNIGSDILRPGNTIFSPNGRYGGMIEVPSFLKKYTSKIPGAKMISDYLTGMNGSTVFPDNSDKYMGKNAAESVVNGHEKEYAKLRDYVKGVENELGISVVYDSGLGKLNSRGQRVLAKVDGEKIRLANFDYIFKAMYENGLAGKNVFSYIKSILAHEKAHIDTGSSNDDLAQDRAKHYLSKTDPEAYEMACVGDKIVDKTPLAQRWMGN